MERFEEPVGRFAALISARRPELTENFFFLKRVGSLSIGVSSALYEKYLMRLEGPSLSPADDLGL